MKDLVEKELSFKITGICFSVHNKYGRFLTEKQYADALAEELSTTGLVFVREPWLVKEGVKLNIGRPDFVIEDRVVIDLKAKKFVTKEDYNQMQKYLQLMNKELGLIINFHSTFLKPKRILNPNLYSEHSDVNSGH